MTPPIPSVNENKNFLLNSLKVTNGQNINDTVKSMTDTEKATVKLFDYNGNGIFDGKEADVFNTSVFNLSEGNINICLKNDNNVEVSIKYSTLESLKNTRIGRAQSIVPFLYNQLSIIDTSNKYEDEKDKNALGHYDISKGIKKITFDYTKDFVQIDGNNNSTGEADFEVHADSIEINNYKPFSFSLMKDVKRATLNNVENPSITAPFSKTTVIKYSKDTEIITNKNTKIFIADWEAE